MIITIDGPAGGGKSTAARNLAHRLGIPFLDTGAMYRALTLKLLRESASAPANSAADGALAERLRELLGRTTIEVTGQEDRLRVRLDGEDVTDAIRTSAVTAAIGPVASDPAVRAWMAEAQRSIADKLGDLVTEGRDQGSVVFPNADVKFYLVADIRARALRRAQEFRDAGRPAEPADIRASLAQRDRDDQQRTVGPLRRPLGAIIIDSTWLSPEQVADAMIEHIQRRGLAPRVGSSP